VRDELGLGLNQNRSGRSQDRKEREERRVGCGFGDSKTPVFKSGY